LKSEDKDLKSEDKDLKSEDRGKDDFPRGLSTRLDYNKKGLFTL